MSTDPELEAMGAVAKAIEGLDQDAQARVIKWISERKGLTLPVTRSAGGASAAEGLPDAPEDPSGHNRKAALWMKQNAVSGEQLDQVFFFSGVEVEIVAPEVSGRSTRERTINAYILCGLAALFRSGSAEFSDQAGRDVCKALGCLDPTNHAKYIGEKGNLLAGSKERGWNVTPQGLKHAAALIKQIAGDR